MSLLISLSASSFVLSTIVGFYLCRLAKEFREYRAMVGEDFKISRDCISELFNRVTKLEREKSTNEIKD